MLDRDGVLNVDRQLNDAGYIVIVVTNQAGVARGLYSEAAIHALHAHMQAQSAHIDVLYYCPHHPDGTVEAFAARCGCRKLGIGMLEQAAREWPIDLGRSFLIGDKDSDMQAAAAFNIVGVRFDRNDDRSLLEVVENAKESLCRKA